MVTVDRISCELHFEDALIEVDVLYRAITYYKVVGGFDYPIYKEDDYKDIDILSIVPCPSNYLEQKKEYDSELVEQIKGLL